MKKMFLVFVLIVLNSLFAQAKSGIDLELGAGVWMPTISGHIQYDQDKNTKGDKIKFDEMEFDKDAGSYIYVDFNHFVPILPNLRLERTNYKIVGNNKNFNVDFGGVTFAGELDMTIDMTQTDIITYWSVPFVSTATAGILDINFGLDAKKYDGSISLEEKTTKTLEKATIDETLPLVYLNFIIDIPFAPIKFDLTTKFVSYKDAKISDNSFKLSYKMPFSNAVVDVNLDVGYRVQNITIPDSLVDNLDLNMDTKGAFYGVSVKF